MTGPAAGKAELRALALSRRAALSAQAHRQGSDRAVAHLRPLIAPRETVALFWPMRGEIDVLPLIQDVRAKGGGVAMPAVDGRAMVFRRFQDEAALERGVFGTRHPPATEPVLHPDLVVAPLAAFDRKGGRIGYGGGYYDKAFAAFRAAGQLPRLVGIAFACQEVSEVPVEPHDQLLAAIATERELITVGGGA